MYALRALMMLYSICINFYLIACLNWTALPTH
jgi:hypothetical protein